LCSEVSLGAAFEDKSVDSGTVYVGRTTTDG
jgi:hypothetical protein